MQLKIATLLFSMPGGFELLLLLGAILLLFGGKNIPVLIKGIAKGIREFKASKDPLPTDSDNNY